MSDWSVSWVTLLDQMTYLETVGIVRGECMSSLFVGGVCVGVCIFI